MRVLAIDCALDACSAAVLDSDAGTIVASDVDNSSVTATLTLSNPAAGSLNTGTSGPVTSTYVAGTGIWSASGAIARATPKHITL